MLLKFTAFSDHQRQATEPRVLIPNRKTRQTIKFMIPNVREEEEKHMSTKMVKEVGDGSFTTGPQGDVGFQV